MGPSGGPWPLLPVVHGAWRTWWHVTLLLGLCWEFCAASCPWHCLLTVHFLSVFSPCRKFPSRYLASFLLGFPLHTREYSYYPLHPVLTPCSSQRSIRSFMSDQRQVVTDIQRQRKLNFYSKFIHCVHQALSSICQPSLPCRENYTHCRNIM